MKGRSRQLHKKPDEKGQHQPSGHLGAQCQFHQIGIVETWVARRLLMQEREGHDCHQQYQAPGLGK